MHFRDFLTKKGINRRGFPEVSLTNHEKFEWFEATLRKPAQAISNSEVVRKPA